MSLLFKIVLGCDRCDTEDEMDSLPYPPTSEVKILKLPKGWKKNVVEDDCEYGQVCPTCVKELREKRK